MNAKLCRFEPHSHSMYSNIRLLDSINRPKDMLLTAAKLGLSGLAITDHEFIGSHVDFLHLEEELKEKEKIPKDFKLGLGNEIYLVNSRNKEDIIRYFHFILIAKDTRGHRALKELSSKAWYNMFVDRGMERVPTLKSELKEIVEKYPNSLIATTACLGGELAYLVEELYKTESQETKQKIAEFIFFMKDLFGEDFYIEVAPSNSKDQVKFNSRVCYIAKELGIKMVIGTDAHYLTKDYRAVHKAYLNSKEGDREVDDFYATAHLMENEECWEYFKKYYGREFFEEMCENSIEIMNKIGTYELAKEQSIPMEDIKDYRRLETNVDIIKYLAQYSETCPNLVKMLKSNSVQDRYWVHQCLEGLYKKDLFKKEYLERLETEADIINFISERMGQPLTAYFNTFQYYIDLFWECGSIVGPGRGSAVGFLSHYLLGITQIDPLKWNLPYWRSNFKGRNSQ